MQPIQLVIKVNAMKMHLFGFLLSLLTSGLMGFSHKNNTWRMGLAVLQGTSAGLLHAFGRVLIIDCSPQRKEGGVFSSWFSWGRALLYRLCSCIKNPWERQNFFWSCILYCHLWSYQ
ncbi:hypothetical protein NC651_001406 [Populus alba x Populus x berolinensis]|nr:hypothetical protein NC651_001406 [Populus alba x Populus x berolinensis]